MTTTAEWLRDQLDRAEMTQAELARDLDATHHTVNRWCRGHAEPDKRNRKALATLFGEQPPKQPYTRKEQT